MANNMTIGPALAIGGNTVELTTTGKVQVTNPKGKIKTLSQDQFKKQLIKNADKIENGEDFEFKSGNAKKALTIAGAAVGTAAVVAGVIYRKKVVDFVKNFDIKKTWKNVKDFFSNTTKKVVKFFKKEKPVRTVFNGEMANQYGFGAEGQKIAKETLRLKEQAQVEIANDIINNVERIKASKMNRIGEDRRIFYEDLLRNFDHDAALKNVKK